MLNSQTYDPDYIYSHTLYTRGFPDNSGGKESACSAWDPSSIPGSGRLAGEEIGHPLQHSWASLVAQLVKNPPAMWETWVWSLGWEDTLEKGKVSHSSILAWRIPWTVQSMGSQSQTWLSNLHFFCMQIYSHVNSPEYLPPCMNIHTTEIIILLYYTLMHTLPYKFTHIVKYTHILTLSEANNVHIFTHRREHT